MDYDQGMNLAVQLSKEGADWQAIAKRLKDEGVKGKRNGQVLTPAAIAWQVRYRNKRKKAPSIKLASTKGPSKKTDLDNEIAVINFAIKTLKNDTMGTKDRVKFAMIILKQI